MNIDRLNVYNTFPNLNPNHTQLIEVSNKELKRQHRERPIQQIGIDILLASDIIREIAYFLSIKDLLSLETCSKILKESLASVWQNLLHMRSIEQFKWSICEKSENPAKWNTVLTVVTMTITKEFFSNFYSCKKFNFKEIKLAYSKNNQENPYFEKFSFLRKFFPVFNSFIKAIAYHKSFKIKKITNIKQQSGEILFQGIFILAKLNLNCNKNLEKFYRYSNQAIDLNSNYFASLICNFNNLKSVSEDNKKKYNNFQLTLAHQAYKRGDSLLLLRELESGLVFSLFDIQKAIDLITQNPEIWPFEYHLALCYYNNKNIAEASQTLKSMFIKHENQIFNCEIQNLIGILLIFRSINSNIIFKIEENLKESPQIAQTNSIKNCAEILKILLKICSKNRRIYHLFFNNLVVQCDMLINFLDKEDALSLYSLINKIGEKHFNKYKNLFLQNIQGIDADRIFAIFTDIEWTLEILLIVKQKFLILSDKDEKKLEALQAFLLFTPQYGRYFYMLIEGSTYSASLLSSTEASDIYIKLNQIINRHYNSYLNINSKIEQTIKSRFNKYYMNLFTKSYQETTKINK